MVSVDSKRKSIERTGILLQGTEGDGRGAFPDYNNFPGLKSGQSLVVPFSGAGKELSMVFMGP